MRGATDSLTIRSRTSTVDTEGQVSYTNSDTTVAGRIMIRNADAVDVGGMRASQPEAVAWVPTGTSISDADQIVVSGMDSFLNGTWEIQGIQYNRAHYRLFLLGART